MACSLNSIFLWLVRWTLRHCGSRITFANTIAQKIMIFFNAYVAIAPHTRANFAEQNASKTYI